MHITWVYNIHNLNAISIQMLAPANTLWIKQYMGKQLQLGLDSSWKAQGIHTVHSYTLNNNGRHTVDYSQQINTDC